MDPSFGVAASSHAGNVRIALAGHLDLAASGDLHDTIASAVGAVPRQRRSSLI